MKKSSKTFSLVLTALFVAIIVAMAFTPLGYIPLVVINATIIHIPVILGSLFLGPKKGALLGAVFGLTSFLKNTLMPTSLSAFVFSPVLAFDVVGVSGIFKSLFICFVPRILVGVVPYFVFQFVKKMMESDRKVFGGTILNGLICLFFGFGIHALLAKAGMAAVINVGLSVVLAGIVFGVIEYTVVKKNANVLSYSYAAVSGALVNTLLVMGSIYLLYKDAYADALSVDASAVLGMIGAVISFNGVIEAIVGAVIVYAVGIVLEGIMHRLDV